MDNVFQTIKNALEKHNSISISNWDTKGNENFNKIKDIYQSSPLFEIDGEDYIIRYTPETYGGGLDQGSPEKYTVTKTNNKNKVVIKTDTPQPLDNPDWSGVVSLAKKIIDDINTGEYYEDGDDEVYVYEEVMKAIYGKDVFDWINKNT